MRTRSGPLQSEDGFTLIEMMMALVILGIGIMSVVGLQTRDMAYNNTSRHQTQGYTWAMDRMERLRGLDYDDPDLKVPKDPDPEVPYSEVQGPYTVRWTVTNATIPNTKRVEVQVKRIWRDPNTGEVREVDVADVSFIRTEFL